MTSRRAIVVGASSGIGAALTLALCRAGYDTAALARRSDRLAELVERIKASGAPGSIRAYPHDVRDREAVEPLFERVVEDLGGLDVLVYNTGVLLPVGPDEYATARDAEMVEVNLLGAMAWLNAAAPWLATQGSGSLVGVSSMAGERGRRGAPAYGASKAGLNTFLESLRNRLASSGVHVLCVKPGFIDTAMLQHAKRTFWVTSPEVAARQILRALERRRETVFVSPRWRLVSWVLRALPSALMRRVPF